MSKGTFLYDVVHVGTGLDKVLALFGVEGHLETFTDIQISNLITPGKADKAARKNARYNSGGIAELYFKNYKAFQRDYRKKYSAQFMKRQGYAPNSTAYTRVNDEAKTELYLEGLYGYSDVTIENVRDKYLSVNEKGQHAIQTLAGYDFATGSVIDGGTYLLTEYTAGVVEETVIINTKRDYVESIEDNLYTNYSYDGTEVTILGEQYVVGTFTSELNINDEYETICTHLGGTLPDEVILTAAERNSYEVTNPVYGTEASYASYRVTSGEVGSELRYWVDFADTLDIYIKINVDITAIVPVKEDNVMVDLDGRKLERMLRKLNLSGEQLRKSIENPDMDGAYLMTGIDPQYDDPITNSVLFKTFDYLAEGNGNISVSISQLDMLYTFSIQKNTINGSIGAVGTADRINASDTGMTLRMQMNSNEYMELVISDFSQRYTISGETLTADFGSTQGFCRVVIPLDVMNALRYRDFEHVYERSLCLLGFSTETVYIEWYETGAFGTVLKIVGFVLSIFTFGLAMALVMMVLMLVVIKLAVKIFGPVLGSLIVAIALVVSMAYGYMPAGSTTEVWLQGANQALGVYGQHLQHEIDKIIGESSEYLESMQEKIAGLEEKSQEMSDKSDIEWFIEGFDSNYAGRTSEVFQTIEEYCNSIVSSTDMGWLVDYNQQIDNNINTRNSVISGTG